MQLEIVRAIQGLAHPVLDFLMQAVTICGESLPLTGLVCLIYWCVNKDTGRYLAIAHCLSLGANGFVKDIVKAPRIFGQPGIRSLRVSTATGYSFPSGHSQASAVLWGGLALKIKRLSLRILCVLLVVLVGFSRLYLGVHYPVDVLAGIGLGAVSAIGVYLLQSAKYVRQILTGLGGLLILLNLFTGESKDTFSAVGLLCGLYPGLWLEQRFARFSTGNMGFAKKALRFGVGLCLLGLVYLLPSLLLPATNMFRVLRMAVVAFFAIGIYPCIFQRLNL